MRAVAGGSKDYWEALLFFSREEQGIKGIK